MKKILICLAMLLLLTGCGAKDKDLQGNEGKNPGKEDTQKPGDQGTVSGYVFKYNDVDISMDSDVAPVLTGLGAPNKYFEAESCAFKGLDKTFYFSGFEITTYPKDENTDYISSIYFNDDSVSTPEGIYIGSSLDELLSAYGQDYTGGDNSYTYKKGNSSILFIVEDEEVTGITYLAEVPGLTH